MAYSTALRAQKKPGRAINLPGKTVAVVVKELGSTWQPMYLIVCHG